MTQRVVAAVAIQDVRKGTATYEIDLRPGTGVALILTDPTWERTLGVDKYNGSFEWWLEEVPCGLLPEDTVVVDSVAALYAEAATPGKTIQLAPGTYNLTEQVGPPGTYLTNSRAGYWVEDTIIAGSGKDKTFVVAPELGNGTPGIAFWLLGAGELRDMTITGGNGVVNVSPGNGGTAMDLKLCNVRIQADDNNPGIAAGNNWTYIDSNFRLEIVDSELIGNFSAENQLTNHGVYIHEIAGSSYYEVIFKDSTIGGFIDGIHLSSAGALDGRVSLDVDCTGISASRYKVNYGSQERCN